MAERDEEYEFEDKECGTTLEERVPDPPVKPRTARLSASAIRSPSGTRISIAPIFDVAASAAVEFDEDRLSVSLDGRAVANFRVQAVSETVVAPIDIVFVLDTTGSMFWAIDGVRAGLDQFLIGLQKTGLDARVGGIEFGDELRTEVALGETEDVRTWLRNMTAIGGADNPESPLDAMLRVEQTFEFRPGALRYMIVITDAGVHERTDGSQCSDVTLAELQSALSPETFVAVLHASLGETLGVAPRNLNDALGGLYLGVNIAQALVEFNISTDTIADDVLENVLVATVDDATHTEEVTLTYDLNGTELRQTVKVVETNETFPPPNGGMSDAGASPDAGVLEQH